MAQKQWIVILSMKEALGQCQLLGVDREVVEAERISCIS